MTQSQLVKSLTFLEIDEQLNNTMEAIQMAQESGHGEMLDQFTGDLRELLALRGDKIDRCVGFIKGREKTVEAINEEIIRLEALKARHESGIEYMKSVAMEVMRKNGVDRLEGNLGREFKISKSSYVNVTNLSALPSKYTQTTTETKANKKAIGDALKNGEIVPGAELATRESVRVR